MVAGQSAVGGADSPVIRLNLGSGNVYAPGWYNVDHNGCPHRRDETVDLTKPLPWPDGHIALAYAGHVLEHLTLPQCRDLLTDLRRCMIPGGALMVVGPDVEVARRIGTGDLHTMGELVEGSQRWPGDEHQWECTAQLVMDLLTETGWRDVKDVGIVNVAPYWPVADREPLWQLAVSAKTARLREGEYHPV